MATCVHCHRTCADPQGGYAAVGDALVCHPNERLRPDCYRLITIYGHQLADCPKCRLSAASRELLAATGARPGRGMAEGPPSTTMHTRREREAMN